MTQQNGNASMQKIVQVESEAGLQHIRKLFNEYAASLQVSLDFQDFDNEMASLPGVYSPPEGIMLLALWNDEVAGCVALRKLEESHCEMKRLYIRPAFRGLKIGRALAESLIQQARAIGYRHMRLDTLPDMGSARALYKSLGFREIDPYRYNPIEGTAYMELELYD